MEMRNKIKIGDMIKYRNEKYVVINKDIIIGGVCMVIELIKLNSDRNWIGYKKIYKVFDERIEECKIINDLK